MHIFIVFTGREVIKIGKPALIEVQLISIFLRLPATHCMTRH